MQFGLKGETIKKAKRKKRRGRGGEGGFAAVREGRRKEARKAMSIIPVLCSLRSPPPSAQQPTNLAGLLLLLQPVVELVDFCVEAADERGLLRLDPVPLRLERSLESGAAGGAMRRGREGDGVEKQGMERRRCSPRDLHPPDAAPPEGATVPLCAGAMVPCRALT